MSQQNHTQHAEKKKLKKSSQINNRKESKSHESPNTYRINKGSKDTVLVSIWTSSTTWPHTPLVAAAAKTKHTPVPVLKEDNVMISYN
jgi:hypothetical protein